MKTQRHNNIYKITALMTWVYCVKAYDSVICVKVQAYWQLTLQAIYVKLCRTLRTYLSQKLTNVPELRTVMAHQDVSVVVAYGGCEVDQLRISGEGVVFTKVDQLIKIHPDTAMCVCVQGLRCSMRHNQETADITITQHNPMYCCCPSNLDWSMSEVQQSTNQARADVAVTRSWSLYNRCRFLNTSQMATLLAFESGNVRWLQGIKNSSADLAASSGTRLNLT